MRGGELRSHRWAWWIFSAAAAAFLGTLYAASLAVLDMEHEAALAAARRTYQENLHRRSFAQRGPYIDPLGSVFHPAELPDGSLGVILDPQVFASEPVLAQGQMSRFRLQPELLRTERDRPYSRQLADAVEERVAVAFDRVAARACQPVSGTTPSCMTRTTRRRARCWSCDAR